MSQGAPKPEGLSSNQTILLALLIGVSLGTVGLVALALMVWSSHQRFGIDRSAKHGISVRNTSRLGGLAATLFLFLFGLSGLEQRLGSTRVSPALVQLPNYIWPAIYRDYWAG